MSTRSPYSTKHRKINKKKREAARAAQVERLATALAWLREHPEYPTYPAEVKRLADRYMVHPNSLHNAIYYMVREDWKNEN